MKKATRPLRVGFDLDGVLLYNPVRIARMPISRLKHRFLPKRRKIFIVPSSRPAKFIWYLAHLSSFFLAPGLPLIAELKKKGLIEPYIVTARFDFLRKDYERWLKKMHALDIFVGAYMNQTNMQPHLFKEKMANKLQLDVFVEDNWDIVDHLSRNTKVKTLWIYNIFDRAIPYQHKYSSLKKAVQYLSSLLEK